MSEPSVFICRGGHHFSEMEMDMGMTMATMNYLMEEQEREHNFETDMSLERELGLDFLDDESQDQWPWYADKQWEVQEPEIIEP